MTKERGQYKYLMIYVTAFVACYMTQAVLLNRLIDLGRFYITGGTFIYFASPLISDVVAEVYGYKTARQLMWLGLFAVIFLTACIAIVIRLPTPPFWADHAAAYFTALNSLLRSTVAGIVAILVGQFVNIYLLTKWKILLKGRYFWLRSVSASIIGDMLTVMLAISIIFSGRIPGQAFTSILFPELIIMVIFSALGGIPAAALAKFTAKAENLNLDDSKTNFNPFKFSA